MTVSNDFKLKRYIIKINIYDKIDIIETVKEDLNMKRLFIISSLILLLTGCSGEKTEDSPDKLNMKDEYTAIKNFVDREMELRKGKLELVDSDEGISAVKDIDINGDGENEKIVTYSVGTDQKTLHFMILKRQSDTYSVVKDVSFRGEDIDKIYIEDLTFNGKKDIIINSTEGNSKILTVYAFENDIEKLLEIDYSTYVVEDIDGNKNIDFIIFKNIGDILSTDYYRYNNDTKKIEFVNENINYINMKNIAKPEVENITKNRKGVVLQGNDGNVQRYTLLFGIDENGKLENMIKDSTEEGSSLTAHVSIEDPNFRAEDIDDDGILDIPRIYLMIEEDEGFVMNRDSYITCVEWFNLKNSKLERKESLIYLEDDRVYFKKPKNWEDVEITGIKRKSSSGIEYSFSKRDPESSGKEDLMTILKTNKTPDSSYELIKKDGENSYYIKVEDKISFEKLRPFKVDENYIIKNFFIE